MRRAKQEIQADGMGRSGLFALQNHQAVDVRALPTGGKENAVRFPSTTTVQQTPRIGSCVPIANINRTIR
jgi:hypothetical protein